MSTQSSDQEHQQQPGQDTAAEPTKIGQLDMEKPLEALLQIATNINNMFAIQTDCIQQQTAFMERQTELMELQAQQQDAMSGLMGSMAQISKGPPMPTLPKR